MLTHTFPKSIEDETNQYKKQNDAIKEKRSKKIYLTPLPMEVLTENQNSNNGRLCDKEGRRKKKALLITSKLVAF